MPTYPGEPSQLELRRLLKATVGRVEPIRSTLQVTPPLKKHMEEAAGTSKIDSGEKF